jgi:hypothetical protein
VGKELFNVGYAVVLNESTIKEKTISTKLDLQIYSAEQPDIKNAIYSTAKHNQKTVFITNSLNTMTTEKGPKI